MLQVEQTTVHGIMTNIKRGCASTDGCEYGCKFHQFGITEFICRSCCDADHCNIMSSARSSVFASYGWNIFIFFLGLNLGLRQFCFSTGPLVMVVLFYSCCYRRDLHFVFTWNIYWYRLLIVNFLLHLHKIVEGLYFNFSLSLCVCVGVCVCTSVCLSVICYHARGRTT